MLQLSCNRKPIIPLVFYIFTFGRQSDWNSSTINLGGHAFYFYFLDESHLDVFDPTTPTLSIRYPDILSPTIGFLSNLPYYTLQT